MAKAVGVDQSSISHYASRFKKMTNEKDLFAAGKEYQVLNEVEALRSLSVELYKSKLTVEEARHGHDIVRAFLKLGINAEQHLVLVNVCQEVEDPSFVESALKLSQIEKQTGMGYLQLMSSFEKAQKKLPQLEEAITKAKAEMASTNDVLLKKKQELADQEGYLKKYQDDVRAKIAQLEKEVSEKIKQLEVEKKEVEKYTVLKKELDKRGLDLKTVLQLAEEFKR